MHEITLLGFSVIVRSLIGLGATPLPPTVPEASLEPELELAPPVPVPVPSVPSLPVSPDVVLFEVVPPTPALVLVLVLGPAAVAEVVLLGPVPVVVGPPEVELPDVWLAVVEADPSEPTGPAAVVSSVGVPLLHAVRVARPRSVKLRSERFRRMSKLPLSKRARSHWVRAPCASNPNVAWCVTQTAALVQFSSSPSDRCCRSDR